jgi:hypothetical protein
MKSIFIAIALMLTCFYASAQTPISAYKVLQGKIGGMNATLHLYLAGGKAGGYLWFAQTPRPMQCYASFNKTKDSLQISAHSNPTSITLNGKLTPSDFAGESMLETEDNSSASQVSNAKKSVFSLRTVTAGFTPFDYVFTSGSARMPAKLKNESTAEYDAATIWPKPSSNSTLANAIKKYVNQEFNNKGAIKEPGKIFVTAKNNFLNEWKNEMNKMTAAEAKDMGLSLSRQTDEAINVVYEDAKVITLSHYSYEYTGGAHGNYVSALQTFNKKTGAVVKLTDVLTKEGIAKLPQLLEAAVRMQYGLEKNKSLEQNGLFVKRMEPSDNFYIANNAIGFIYSTYEIFSYAYGEPNVFIPASAIGMHIKAPYKN